MRSAFAAKALKIIILVIGIVIVADIGFIYVIGKVSHTTEKADAIIVLGSAHTDMAAARAKEGLKLYEEGKSNTLVLTGGQTSSTTSEAAYMKSVILRDVLALKLAPPHMLLEEHAQNTLENLQFSEKLIPGAHSVIIVTDQFHVARSLVIAQKLGYEDVYWDSPQPSYLPMLTRLQYYLREMVALPAALL